MFYQQMFRTLRSPIAQSDSKIACRYYFQVDYELCACDIPGTFKKKNREECPPFIYSIIFNMYAKLNKNNKNTGIRG